MKVKQLASILADMDQEEEICFLSYEKWMYRGLIGDDQEVPESIWIDAVREFEKWGAEDLQIHEWIAEAIIDLLSEIKKIQ
jgi:hypothetical protein